MSDQEPSTEGRARLLLELERMESTLVRAGLERPGELPDDARRALRYVLGFARLATFRPGAAGGHRSRRRELSVGAELDPVRGQIADALRPHLRGERDAADRLRGARAALWALTPDVTRAREQLLQRDGLTAQDIDAEAGTRTLVSVAGGGGGAGYVYIGAYQHMEERGIVPGFVVGASIGALLGLFRARARKGDWDAYIALAKNLDRRELFAPLSSLPARRRHGLPGLLSLRLGGAVGAMLSDADGRPLRIDELEIPYEAIAAGVRLGAFERLPRRFRATPTSTSAPQARRSTRVLTAGVATRLWQVAAFIDPRVVKPIVLGDDALTRACNGVDAAGFSAAIPGVLHYDVDPADERSQRLFDEVMETEEVGALVDGGVASNVPVELAWRRVQDGRIGTRNAVYLAFDCFHPQWDPRHLWLQPITQAVQLQMTRNAPFADWIVRFEPTLSPIDLVPDPDRLERAIGWGRASIEPALPLLERLLEPVGWDPQ